MVPSDKREKQSDTAVKIDSDSMGDLVKAFRTAMASMEMGLSTAIAEAVAKGIAEARAATQTPLSNKLLLTAIVVIISLCTGLMGRYASEFDQHLQNNEAHGMAVVRNDVAHLTEAVRELAATVKENTRTLSRANRDANNREYH